MPDAALTACPSRLPELPDCPDRPAGRASATRPSPASTRQAFRDLARATRPPVAARPRRALRPGGHPRVDPPEARVPLLTLAGGSKPGRRRPQPRRGRPGDVPPPARSSGSRPGRRTSCSASSAGRSSAASAPRTPCPSSRGRGRTPITIDEGIAVVTQRPELLEKNKCFMLSGSRRHDRRVPAFWISERAPKLGWCWDGNPHSWLGVATRQAAASAREGPRDPVTGSRLNPGSGGRCWRGGSRPCRLRTPPPGWRSTAA